MQAIGCGRLLPRGEDGQPKAITLAFVNPKHRYITDPGRRFIDTSGGIEMASNNSIHEKKAGKGKFTPPTNPISLELRVDAFA